MDTGAGLRPGDVLVGVELEGPIEADLLGLVDDAAQRGGDDDLDGQTIRRWLAAEEPEVRP
jgi:hypothetical protein